MNQGEPATLVWVNEGAPRTQHTIMSLYGRRQEWLAAVQAAFEAELRGQYRETLDSAEEIVSTIARARRQGELHGKV